MTRFASLIHATSAHLARATLEATAFQTLDVLRAMEADSGVPLAELKVDGGMVANELLMQFQADVTGSDVIRPRVTETTALGAAYAAGLAVGYWSGVDEIRRLWGEDRRWHATTSSEERAELHTAWNKAVERTFDWES